MIAKRLPDALTLRRGSPRGNRMMIMFKRYSAMAATGAMIICGSPASGQERGPAKWSGFCDLDVGPPRPCTISDEISADGQHDLRFAFAGTAVSFLAGTQVPGGRASSMGGRLWVMNDIVVTWCSPPRI